MKYKLVLRKDKKNAKGEHPVVLRIGQGNNRKYLGFGIVCHSDHWDEGFMRIRPTESNYSLKNEQLDDIQQRTEESIKRIRQTKRIMTIPLFLRFFKLKYQEYISADKMFEIYMKEKDDAGSYGGADAYRQSLRILKKHVNGKVLQFDEIDYNWLNGFEQAFLKRGCSKNTIGLHLRHLRTIFNEAIRRDYLSLDEYPFRKYRLGRLKEAPNPRYLSIDEFNTFRSIELEPGSSDWKAQQYFIFSAYTRGMNFTDMASLMHSNIQNNRIVFNRSKTSVAHNIEVNEKIAQLINDFQRYAPGKDGYLFPIISNSNNMGKNYINRKTKTRQRVNLRLRRLATEHLDLDFNLTHGKARHTFANALIEQEYDVRTIQKLMNHTSVTTTEIYLGKFKNEVIDTINKNVFK